MKILISHSDSQVLERIQTKLNQFGWIVDMAVGSHMTLFHLKITNYDAVLLEYDGVASDGLLRSIKAESSTVPVLLLLNDNRNYRLPTNWCDTIRAPFRTRDIVAKVLLLTHEREWTTSLLHCGDLTLNLATKQATLYGRPITLARKEIQLLEFLMRNQNRVVTRSQIHESIWEQDGDPLTNSIEVHMSRLRRKLERIRKKRCIETAYGFGYILKG